MNIGRREFMGGMLALGACGCRPTDWFGSSAAMMKLGVVSDIHLHSPGDEDTFVRALEYFRDNGADAVLIAGDIADRGTFEQLKRCADAWFGVFPNDRAPDGRHVERLFIYGNHCVESWTWGNCFKGDEAGAKARAIGYGNNRARFWEELFHEEFKPIWMKRVKGIPVIGAHWEERGNGIAIEDFMKAHGREIDPALPFVYTQHAHPQNTCFGAWAWGHDDGRATRALSPFPNAVAFSGHSHYPFTDERSVWQGDFTSINAGSLRYSSHDYALRENLDGNDRGFTGENRWHRMKSFATGNGRQGMLVSFFDDHLAIERREFFFGESLGPDWIVPLPAAESQSFSYAARARKRCAPQFAADASVTVTVAEPTPAQELKAHGVFFPPAQAVNIDFPAAHTVDGCRVFEYEVTAVLCEDDVDLVQAQHRMISPDFHLPETKCVDRVTFTFDLGDLTGKGHYRFEVRPLECFGKKGEPIVSEVINLFPSPKETNQHS